MLRQTMRLALVSFAAFGVLFPAAAAAQRAQTRAGFWFNGGIGFGSAGCDGCDGRETAPTITLTFGGTISPKFLLGASLDGWSKEEGGTSLTVGTLLARMRFYPSATGGFFLTAGLGMGTVTAEVSGLGSDSETGTGVLVGLGYDIRVGRNLSITPFWQGFATHTSSTDFNVGQLGLGITTH